jgi:hypothetical protein
MTRIDWAQLETDRLALALASIGISVQTISASTGLTKAQVQYRMSKAGIRLTQYRKGETPLSRYLATCVAAAMENRLNALPASKVTPEALSNSRAMLKAWKQEMGGR